MTITTKKGEVDFSSPESIVIIILCILLGIALLYYVWTLKGRLMP